METNFVLTGNWITAKSCSVSWEFQHVFCCQMHRMADSQSTSYLLIVYWIEDLSHESSLSTKQDLSLSLSLSLSLFSDNQWLWESVFCLISHLAVIYNSLSLFHSQVTVLEPLYDLGTPQTLVNELIECSLILNVLIQSNAHEWEWEINESL